MKCPYCENEISDDAKACIHCWHDLPQNVNETQRPEEAADSDLAPILLPDPRKSQASEPAGTVSVSSVPAPAEATPAGTPEGISEAFGKVAMSAEAGQYSVPLGMPPSLEAVWRLSDVDLAAARHSTVVLKRIGMLFYLLPFLCASTVGSWLFRLYTWLFYIVCWWPVGYVLRNVRTVLAQRRLKHISIVSAGCSLISIGVALFFAFQIDSEGASNEFAKLVGYYAGALLLPCIYGIIWLYVLRHCRNPHIFAEDPCSPAEVEFIWKNRWHLAKGAAMTYPARYEKTFLGAIALFGCLLSYLMAILFIFAIYMTSTKPLNEQKAMKGLEENDAMTTPRQLSRPVEEMETEEVRQNAAAGDVRAQQELALRFFTGSKGVERDERQAVLWLRKAAELGDPYSQAFLGDMYFNGTGIQQDDGEAAKWWQKSAEQGCAEGQWRVGQLHYMGRGVPKDDAEAVKWFQKSAEQGSADGQFLLGRCCMEGWGRTADPAEAVKWFQKAAEQGQSGGQIWLGLCLGNGVGAERDVEAGAQWLRKAYANPSTSEEDKKFIGEFLEKWGKTPNQTEDPRPKTQDPKP